MKWIDCETKKINAFNYGVSCVYYLFYSRESNKNVSSDNDNTLIYKHHSVPFASFLGYFIN